METYITYYLLVLNTEKLTAININILYILKYKLYYYAIEKEKG